MTRTDIDHYDGLAFWGPYDEAMIDSLVRSIHVPEDARALDIGCGDGAVLLRLALEHDALVLGVDRSEAALVLARHAFAQEGLEDRAAWFAQDASGFQLAPDALDIGVWLGGPFVGDSHASTMQAFGTWIKPGGWMLLGQGYWITPPPAAYLEATGMPADTLDDEATMLAAVTDAGFEITSRMESSRAVWDHFEGTIHANHEAYAAAHPDDADVQAMLASKQTWHDAQQRWGRDVMGFALYTARRL